jgi:hypothetical protein
MVAMMVERHPPVAWVSHRLWYYPLPFQALAVFAALWGLDHLARRPGGLPRLVPIGVAALVVLNVAQWPEMRAEIDTDPAFSDQLRRSALLVRSLRQGHAELLLDGDHRRFYFEFLDTFPRFAGRARVQVGEGEGVLLSEIRNARVVAWAKQQSHLVARTDAPGTYLLVGSVRLRPGDSVDVILGSPPRRIARLERTASLEGVERVRIPLDLPAGLIDLMLLSRLPEFRVPDLPRRTRAAYQVELPFLLWPATRAESAQYDSTLDTPQSRH